MSFEEQNEIGKGGERRVFDSFVSAGCFVQLRHEFHRRDLSVITPSGMLEFIEVKCEDRYATSGNVCIEVRQGSERKWSGLMKSESTVFVHTLNHACLAYRTNDMRLWLLENGRQLGEPKVYGDNNNRCYLLPVGTVKKFPFADFTSVRNLPWSKLFQRLLPPPLARESA